MSSACILRGMARVLLSEPLACLSVYFEPEHVIGLLCGLHEPKNIESGLRTRYTVINDREHEFHDRGQGDVGYAEFFELIDQLMCIEGPPPPLGCLPGPNLSSGLRARAASPRV